MKSTMKSKWRLSFFSLHADCQLHGISMQRDALAAVVTSECGIPPLLFLIFLLTCAPLTLSVFQSATNMIMYKQICIHANTYIFLYIYSATVLAFKMQLCKYQLVSIMYTVLYGVGMNADLLIHDHVASTSEHAESQ